MAAGAGSSSSAASSGSARDDVIRYLEREYDPHISRFFDLAFPARLFNFEFDEDSKTFSIHTITEREQAMSLQCKIMMLTVKLGLIVPPLVEGKFTSVKRGEKSYKRIDMNVGKDLIHYDSSTSNLLLKLFTSEMHDDLRYIDMEEGRGDHHTLLLTGMAWESTLDSSKLDYVSLA